MFNMAHNKTLTISSVQCVYCVFSVGIANVTQMEYLSVRQKTRTFIQTTHFFIYIFCVKIRHVCSEKKTILYFNAALCHGVCCFSWLSLTLGSV